MGSRVYINFVSSCRFLIGNFFLVQMEKSPTNTRSLAVHAPTSPAPVVSRALRGIVGEFPHLVSFPLTWLAQEAKAGQLLEELQKEERQNERGW